MKFEESLTETSRERGRGFGYSAFRSRKFSGETGKEVILSLLRRKDRYGRKNPECVCRKENYALCIRRGGNGTNDVRDMIDRIGNAGVFRNALIGKVDFTVLVESYVLEKRVSSDCVVNVRFGILVEIDNLRVATAFEVKHAVIVPAVFVIADKKSFRIGGKGGFTRSGKPEENRGVFAVKIGVRGTVHRSNALQRKVIVHHREHTFFHFAAVPGVDNDLFSARYVEHNGGFGVKSEFFIVFNFSLGSVVNDEIGFKVFEFFLGGFDKHVCDEVSLPCNFHYEADCHARVFIRAAECVHDVKFFAGKFVHGDFLDGVPRFDGCGMVVVFVFVRSPPYGVFGIIVHNDEFIFWRTTCINTRHDVYSAEFADLSFFITLQSRIGFFFEKFFVRRIVYDFFNAGYTVFG